MFVGALSPVKFVDLVARVGKGISRFNKDTERTYQKNSSEKRETGDHLRFRFRALLRRATSSVRLRRVCS